MWTNKSIPLVTGFDASIGESHGDASILERLVNAHVSKQGEIGKRLGFNDIDPTIIDKFTATRRLYDLDGANLASVPRALVTNLSKKQGESLDGVLYLTDKHLFKYSPTLAGWLPRDVLFQSATEGFYQPSAVGCSVSSKRVLKSASDQHGTQTAANSNYTVVSWIECEIGSAELDPRLYYSIYDNASGDYIVDGILAESSDVLYSMCAGVGSSLGIVYISGNNLKLIDVSSPLAPVTYTLKTTATSAAAGSGNATPFYVATSHTNALVIAYRDTGAGVPTVFFSTYGGTVSGTTSYGAATVESIAIEYDSVSSRYVLAYCTGVGANNITTRVLNTSLVDQAINVLMSTSDAAKYAQRITLGFNNKLIGVSASTIDTCYILWEHNTSGNNIVDIQSRSVSAATTTTLGASGTFFVNTTLLSTVFKQNDQLYVALGYCTRGTNSTTFQGAMHIVAIGPHTYDSVGLSRHTPLCMAGRFSSAATGCMDNRRFDRRDPPCRVSAYGSLWRVGHRVKTKYIQSVGSARNYFTRSVFLTLNFAAPVSHATVDDFTYIANGSLLKQHDGRGVTETGFLLSPEISASDGSAAGAAGALSAGDYSWRFYYEREIGGKRVRSYATTVTKTIAANNTVTWTIPTLRFTQCMEDDVYIVVYRTAVNPTANSPFYRLTSLSPTAATGVTWTRNSFTTANVTIVDALADTSLQAETDYLYANEVAHIVPDIAMITQHGRRLIGASDYAIHPSLFFNSRDAVEFSDELTTEMNDTGGPIRGLASLGNNLAIIKKNRTFVVSGEGPDNTGVGLYSDPYEVNNTVGASGNNAVCKIPGGILFGGEAGFYVLNDGLNLEFIGKPVYDYFKATGESVSAVVYNAKQNYFYIQCQTVAFVYYTLYGIWSVWVLPTATSYGACVYGDYLMYAGATASISVQQASQWRDEINTNGSVGNTNYIFVLETRYIPVSGDDNGTNGRAKSVKFLGKYFAGGAFNMGYTISDARDNDIVYDYTDYFGGVLGNNRSYSVDGTNANQHRFEHHFAQQKCSAVKVRISGTGNHSGNLFTHLVLRVKESQNSAKLSPQETT